MFYEISVSLVLSLYNKADIFKDCLSVANRLGLFFKTNIIQEL